jgi:uncharacterized protein YndB with AHSA1/START domain
MIITMKVEKSVTINVPPSNVWEYLTDSSLMSKWMGDPEMNIEVITDWKVGSSISRLPDTKENYSVNTFTVSLIEEKTHLKIEVENFPTETIYKHLNFYWQGTIILLKNLIEQ